MKWLVGNSVAGSRLGLTDAVAAYTAAAILVLRALRRAEEPRD